MLEMIEPRRTGMCGRGSEMASGGDVSDYTAPTFDFHTNQQAAWIAARQPVSPAVARLLAEHSAGLVHSRASR